MNLALCLVLHVSFDSHAAHDVTTAVWKVCNREFSYHISSLSLQIISEHIAMSINVKANFSYNLTGKQCTQPTIHYIRGHQLYFSEALEIDSHHNEITMQLALITAAMEGILCSKKIIMYVYQINRKIPEPENVELLFIVHFGIQLWARLDYLVGCIGQ